MKMLFLKKLMSRQRAQAGFSLIEALVGISLIAITGLTLTQSSIFSLQMRDKAIADSLAAQLALETLEEYSATDPSTLSDGDTTNDTISRGGKSFTVVSTVSVNADSSRTVDVTVTADSSKLDVAVTMSNVFPLWEI